MAWPKELLSQMHLQMVEQWLSPSTKVALKQMGEVNETRYVLAQVILAQVSHEYQRQMQKR
jgi:hypothetical protein